RHRPARWHGRLRGGAGDAQRPGAGEGPAHRAVGLRAGGGPAALAGSGGRRPPHQAGGLRRPAPPARRPPPGPLRPDQLLTCSPQNRRPRPAPLFVPALLTLLLPAGAGAFHHKETNGPATLEVRTGDDRPGIALADVLRVVVTLEGGKGLKVESPV